MFRTDRQAGVEDVIQRKMSSKTLFRLRCNRKYQFLAMIFGPPRAFVETLFSAWPAGETLRGRIMYAYEEAWFEYYRRSQWFEYVPFGLEDDTVVKVHHPLFPSLVPLLSLFERLDRRY